MTASQRKAGRCLARFALGLAALASAGCGSVVHQVQTDRKPLVAVADQFSGSGGGGAQVEARWWRALGSGDLSRLCEATLQGNLDVRRAATRVQQAAALARVQGAALLPTASVSGQVQTAQQNFFFGANPASGGGAIAVTQTTFPLNLNVSWEVDIWGRALNAKRAATRDMRAAQHDRHALGLSLTAQVADAWLRLVEARARQTLLAEQRKLNEQLLTLTKLRFGQGMASSVDVLQQEQQLETVAAQEPNLKLAEELAANQVRMLVGKAPGTEVALGDVRTLPKLPPLPATGVPAKLLARRPDVKAAQQRLIAADHRLGSAKANLLPGLRLGGSAGFQGRADPFGFLDNFVGSLFAGLTAPLFQGGRIRGDIDRNRAALTDAVLAYTQVVQRALWEVENALTQERHQRESLRRVDARLALARETLGQARARFAAGQSTYLPVLQAVSTLQRLEGERIGAQRALLSTRVQLYRALAGTTGKSS